MGRSDDGALRRIVVGVDGSEQSNWALRWAKQLAGEDTVIDAVIAWDYPANYGFATWGFDDWRPDLDAQKALQDAVDQLFGAHPPLHLNRVVTTGNAAAVLLEASKDADLLIVGSRGHGGFAGLLLGSVSARCAEHAHCAVLVAHRPPPVA